MSFDIEKIIIGRRPALLCEIDLDKCANLYSQSRVNLVTDPEDFAAVAWAKTNHTIIQNSVVSPDGKLTADSLVRTASGNHFTRQRFSTTAHAENFFGFSVWIKGDGIYQDNIVLRIREGGDATEIVAVSFALTTEWKRVDVSGVFDPAPTADIDVFIDPVNDSGSAGDTFYLWGAQLTEGNILYDYGVATCEASQGNLIIRAEEFANAAWTKVGSPITTSDSTIAPDGILTADTLEDNSAVAFANYRQQVTSGFDVQKRYTASVFIKKDSTGRATRFPQLSLEFAGLIPEQIELSFDTDTGEFLLTPTADTDAIAGVIDHNADWWRIFCAGRSIEQANTNCTIRVLPAKGASLTWVETVATLGEIIAWGAQLSETDFIPVYTKTVAAAIAATGAVACFNTRTTCQDFANYNNRVPLTHKFSNVLIPGQPYIHCIAATTLAPTVIDPNKGLGIRAEIRMTMSDFPHHDRGLDNYLETRNYKPEDQGTYWPKLMARNTYFSSRAYRIFSGYVSAGGFDINDFQARHYVLEKMVGPDQRGNVSIVAKDILKLADDVRAQAPAPSTGLLVADISAAATSLTVTNGTEGEYNLEGDYIQIEDETILAPVGNRAANVFSNLTRGVFNSIAETHELDDSVQACKDVTNTNCVDLARDLLLNYARIDSRFIIDVDWDAERDTWYSTSDINTLITESEGVEKLINELAEQFHFQIWSDEILQTIIFKAIVPPRALSAIPLLTDDAGFLKKSLKVKRNQELRLSRVAYYYRPNTPVEVEDVEDYAALKLHILASEEGPDLYDDIRQRVILARFVTSSSIAVQTAGRLLSRFRDAPREIEFKLDAKDQDLWTGDFFDAQSRRLAGPTGAPEITRFQVTRAQELTREASGTTYQYKALELNYGARYAYIGPDTLNDYGAESEDNKALYAFIAPDTAIFSDQTEAYRII